ncbi:tetratricopeptide repeat protein [Marispirochaeta aestuarii]|uniref:tetratricopeptide repeat protein n=1 Tax=Marispirochaeta aestuarii TaxID=1963862 RepID=UPI0029C6BC42|nr:tetratricopeptide repeat protein [Marispirochaeta aestuarii]
MEKNLLILLFPLLLLSCTPYRTHWQVLKGNYEYINGRYQSAAVSYLGILENELNEDEVIHYNLGNVFYALGETTASEDEWTRALEGENPELKFRTLFNMGNLYYELSQYRSAFESFKKALLLRPDSREAKRNMELTLLRLGSQQEEERVLPSAGSVSGGDTSVEEVDRILQYIKRKEESQWVSQHGGDQESSGPFW